MKRLLAVLLFLVPALALGKTWQVQPAQSHLGFQGSFQGDAFEGRFKTFDATIVYDPADLAGARFDVEVDLASVDTQSAERDQTLKGTDFFDVADHPRAHFVTESFRKQADGTVLAHGTLQLRDATRPVDLAVDFRPDGDRATLDVTTDLSRLDYGLGEGGDWDGISKTIKVSGHLVLQATGTD